jgi:hypothetical protein
MYNCNNRFGNLKYAIYDHEIWMCHSNNLIERLKTDIFARNHIIFQWHISFLSLKFVNCGWHFTNGTFCLSEYDHHVESASLCETRPDWQLLHLIPQKLFLVLEILYLIKNVVIEENIILVLLCYREIILKW